MAPQLEIVTEADPRFFFRFPVSSFNLLVLIRFFCEGSAGITPLYLVVICRGFLEVSFWRLVFIFGDLFGAL
ncbi:MAG: hypothetical protein DRJ44_07540 [Thermoprotei archaeon]|nr:MAG: hypothetical protein DRJ44_07540 [Thermoprotei archaeon]